MTRKYRLVVKFVGPFSRLHWQILISLVLAVATAVYANYATQGAAILKLSQPNQLLSVLGVIGALLALATSVSYGHLVQVISDSKSELNSSYHRFKNQLFKIDQLVDTFPDDDPVKYATREMTSEMKMMRLEDQPFSANWEEISKPILDEVSKKKEDESWNPRYEDLVSRLLYGEELLSNVGLAFVKQAISSVFLRPVVKGLAVIAGIILSGIGVYFLISIDEVRPVLSAVPVFFASFSSLIFAETGLLVFRYTHEYAYQYVEEESQGDMET